MVTADDSPGPFQGITFNPSRLVVPTKKAHILLEYAAREGKQHEMQEVGLGDGHVTGSNHGDGHVSGIALSCCIGIIQGIFL